MSLLQDTEFVSGTTVLTEAYMDGINDFCNGIKSVVGETFTATDFRTGLAAAKSGANTDITSLGGLTTALSIAQGGTGVSSLPTSLAVEGYTTLPGGLVLQWGVLAFTTGATQTWTFPSATAFTTAVLHCGGIVQANTSQSVPLTVWDATGRTLTTAKYQWQAGAFNAFVFALGY